MKILQVGDPHLSDVQIRTRIDISKEVSIAKLDNIAEIAQQYKVDMVLLMGDVFSSPIRNKDYLCQVIEAFNRINMVCPLYTITGNHRGDIDPPTVESWKKKDLGILFKGSHIKVLEDVFDFDGGRIKAYPAYIKLKEQESDPKVTIIACHHFINQGFGDHLIVFPNQLKELYPNLKLVLAGHDHAEYKVGVTKDGVIVSRPGSMMRVSSASQNNRIPKVAVINTIDNSVEYVPLSVAKPYNEVFSTAKKEMKKAVTKTVAKFISGMRTSSALEGEVGVSEVMFEQLSKVQDPDLSRLIKEDLVSHGFLQ